VRLLPAPPARFATDALFDACDVDGTGFVEKAEFATYARSLAFGVAARHAERAREVQKPAKRAPRDVGRTHIAVEVSAPPRRPPLAPEDLARAAALFEHIARRVDMDSADRAGGFGVAKRDIAYGRVFRKLCVFGEESLDAGELVRACRRAFLDNLKGVADADLRLLYRAIDEDNTGVVALEDFARFSKKIRGRLFDVQVARPEPPAPATRESRVSASDRARAEAILGRLGEVVASRGGSSGFDDAHRGQGVSFARLFRVLDPGGAMDRADLIEAVKKRTATVSADDLGFLFDVIDEDRSGLVTLGEFRAFSKRVAVPGEGFRTGGGPLSETRGTTPLPPATPSPGLSATAAKPKWTPRSVKLADRSRDCRGGPPARSRRPLCLDGRAKKLVPQ